MGVELKRLFRLINVIEIPPSAMVGATRLTMVIYALYALAGVKALIAVIVNYVKRCDVQGTWLESHFKWQIRTFWWGLASMIVSLVLTVVGIGIVLMIGSALWYIYRIVKGFLYLNDEKPMYAKA